MSSSRFPLNRLGLHISATLLLFILLVAHNGLAADPQITQYTCPMHPHYISDTFGSCPICGMDLVEVKAQFMGKRPEADSGLHLPDHLVQRSGVRSQAAEIGHFGRTIRSFGEVVVNQRLQTDVSLRVEGWIHELLVNAEGDEVERGTLLFRFYSPQIVAAQQDYLTALASGAQGRIQVTRDRLRSLGVQEQVIQRIRDSGESIRNLPYFAEQQGRVEEIIVRQGSYLRSGAVAMRIQGYEKVWIQVNLAEQDISFVGKDSRVDVDFPNLGIHREQVAIDYIAPTVDPTTRTAQLRLILDNNDGIIRPGAFADVTIMTDIAPRLAIPYQSVLQNKEGSYVIVARDDGVFQAREIKLGMQYKGIVEVQAGLTEGEQVVVSGQFLIDSESSLRESFQRMERIALSLAELDVSEQQLVLLNHMIEGMLYVHEELMAKRFPSPEMLDAAEQAARKLGHEMGGNKISFIVEDYLTAIDGRAEIMTISGWQELLSQSMAILTPWIVEGRPRYYRELGLALFTTEDDQRWIQFAGDQQNPYESSSAREIPLNESGMK